MFRSLLQKQTIRSREILYFATIKSNRSNSPLEKRRKRRNSRLPTAILVERSQSGGEMFSSGSLKTRKRGGRKKGVVHQRWRRGGKWPCNTGRYRLAHRASARTPCPNFQDTKERYAHTYTHVDDREQPSFENIEFDEERERVSRKVFSFFSLWSVTGTWHGKSVIRNNNSTFHGKGKPLWGGRALPSLSPVASYCEIRTLFLPTLSSLPLFYPLSSNICRVTSFERGRVHISLRLSRMLNAWYISILFFLARKWTASSFSLSILTERWRNLNRGKEMEGILKEWNLNDRVRIWFFDRGCKDRIIIHSRKREREKGEYVILRFNLIYLIRRKSCRPTFTTNSEIVERGK